MDRPAGNTTLPAESTQEQSQRTSLELRWVFPSYQAPGIALVRSPLLIGRGDDCDVVVQSTEVSRRHAELRREGPIWIVRDLQSRNGVFVDGARTDQAPIQAGTVLRLGDWVSVIACVREPAQRLA